MYNSMEMMLSVAVYCAFWVLSVTGNYAPSPDNVVIAAPHRRTDIHGHAHGDTEYPTNEEVFADPEIRNNFINNYNQKAQLKHRLHGIIIPESESDILIGE